jgi:hypothetical protein
MEQVFVHLPLYTIVIFDLRISTLVLIFFSFSFYLRIDRNFCSVNEKITSIRLYTPCNKRSRLHKSKGVDNMIDAISNELNKQFRSILIN